MNTRQDYIVAISGLVAGELPLSEPDKIAALSSAVKRYSGDNPREIPEDITGDGGFDYPVAQLAHWADKFSKIIRVEYPVDDTSPVPPIVSDTEWRLWNLPSGQQLRFLHAKPAATETIRIIYTALHTCDDDTCTIPSVDAEAVARLAAAEFCDMVATYYANTADSVIQADSVAHASRAQEYAARARAYRASYSAHMGMRGSTPAAASVTRDQDATPSWRSDHLTHPRRWR